LGEGREKKTSEERKKITNGRTLCFGSAGPERLELALLAFVDGIEGPVVA